MVIMFSVLQTAHMHTYTQFYLHATLLKVSCIANLMMTFRQDNDQLCFYLLNSFIIFFLVYN